MCAVLWFVYLGMLKDPGSNSTYKEGSQQLNLNFHLVFS